MNVLLQNIVQGENELKFFLSFNRELTIVKNRIELSKLINEHLKDLLDFDYSTIFLFSGDKGTVDDFLFDPESQFKDNPFRQSIDAKYFETVFSDDCSEIHNLSSYLNNGQNGHLNGGLAFNLYEGSGIIGYWVILYKKRARLEEEQLQFLRFLAGQLSLSVIRIKTNAEISKREREKTLLLSFSNELATVRDKKGVGDVIKRYLKNLFLISEYIITVKNDDNKTYSYFLFDLVENTPTDKEFQTIVDSNIPMVGSLTGAVLQSEEPVIFDIDEILQNKKFNFPTAQFWKAIGAKRILGTRLIVANEDIGILWVEAGVVNDHLLHGIAAQIAIALANAIANDKVERQLKEINRYKKQLEEEKVYLKQEIAFLHNNSEIIGNSLGMRKISQLIAQVAPTETTVMILGETGTGKELIARAIHNNSPRKSKLMVKVNCAAIPASLIESELFGHERGSFTGATERRIGKFELAHNGTLFLDEVGEMPWDLQVKLLRALQEKEIERVGGKGTIKVDVRIIAATNRDLEKEMEEGKFRRDLYYRLYIFPIELPPLKDRQDDIPLLASHFIHRYAKKLGKPIQSLSSSALNELIEYNWPGNIRELEHLIERSIILTSGNTIKQIHLPSKKQGAISKKDFVIQTLFENEREHIYNTLKYCNNRVGGEGGAAQLLGVPASTLNSKMKKLKIKKEHNLRE